MSKNFIKNIAGNLKVEPAVIRNRRGAALILSYMVIGILTIFGSALVSRSISNSNIARRYEDSSKAFWIAEAGLNQAYYKLINGENVSTDLVNFANGSYQVLVNNTPTGIEIKSTGTYGSTQRAVKAYLLRIPYCFDNTISVGGDLSISGLMSGVTVYGKARISGDYTDSSGSQTAWFEDLQQDVNSDYTTIQIPDKNNNGTADEFNDFVILGQQAIEATNPNEVVYIVTDDTVNIFPDQALSGKRIVFIEGSAPGRGDVNIFFDGSWQEGEDLTIISTGTITYIQPLQFQEDARLSTISWGDYNQSTLLRSEHESIIYTHGNSNFSNVQEWSSISGNIISNNNISIDTVYNQKFYFSQRAMYGDLPPAFEYLAPDTSNVPTQLINWQEE